MDVAVRVEAVLGEGPTWDVLTGTLVWVDILSSEAHRYDPVTGKDEVLALPQHVGAVKPRAGGGLVANLRDGVALLERDGSRRWLVYWGRDGYRGNDAGIDPAGRLWAGTTAYGTGSAAGWLACVEPSGAARVALDDVQVSNGIGWSPDGTRLYFIDSPTNRVDVFDYDVATGDAVNRRPLCAVAGPGSPDGLCVDADGCVWVALWDGSAIRRYTPTGDLDREIQAPVSRPTACCFGGPDLTDLYVTTARRGLTEAQLSEQPLAGSVLVFPGAGTGHPTTAFAG
ncbi:SMP-30/gluconolactonase/LRE family protein [Actinokineospora iranica]|uniref:Sugar lactone lactonase YvrE n=1 Tax=Actinokineospora iranica TaxID=1271860 RepID=A0A1G6X2Z4_9PSEU|nr:SMP-30/gluconolactonase/LRE family protein [Actinokineospora iranica]SDD72570.1 Sugar lactone lactonase YvrE [Actinokineospora iranica]